MPETPSVTVHIGPARSGKAAMMRCRYLELATGADPRRVLLLVPTGERRVATLEVLLDESPGGVLWAPQVTTFPRYAEELLGRLAAPARRVTAFQRHGLIAAAVEACRGKGLLRHFEPIVDTAGFLDSLDAFIHKLKTHEVRPEAFARSVPRERPSLRATAAVYTRYQATLTDLALYDDAGLFWQAQDAMAQAPADFGWPQVVLADGFQDFSPAQRGVLAALHGRGAEVVIALPCQVDRPMVFAQTERTLRALKVTFGDAVSVVASEAKATKGREVLSHLERGLFDDDVAGRSLGADGAVCFVEAAGMRREVEAIARKVKRLLQADAPRSPGDVAVILRRREPYAELVAEVFERYGLPVAAAPACRLDRLPPVRWLVSLLRLPVDNHRWRDVAAVVRSPYFPRRAFAASEADVAAADRLLHRLGVFEGAEAHLLALHRQVEALETQAADADAWDEPDRIAADLAAARGAHGLLTRLFDRLSQLPQQGSRREHVEAVAALLDEVSWQDAATGVGDVSLMRRDLAALEAVRGLLDAMSDLADWTADGTRTLAEFAREFDTALRTVEIAPPRRLGRAVRILDVRSSRALSFPIVVLPGLGDGHWPAPQRPHLMETPENRGVLSASGLEVDDRETHLAAERLLFYMAVTRAAERLIVSRASFDEDGRPQLASPFWDELVRLTTHEGTAPPVEAWGVRDTDLPLDEAANLEEVRRLAMSALATGGKAATDMLAGVVRIDPAAAAMLAGCAVVRERESERAFGRFDGVLASPEVLSQFEAEYPGDHVFSIRRLEDYAACPFRFFAVTVLGLAAWEAPQEYAFEAREVGDLYHAALARFYIRRRRQGAGVAQLESQDPARLRAEMARAVKEVFASRSPAGEGGLPALWKVQQEEIGERLAAYLAAEVARCRTSALTVEPRLFEWAFGTRRRPADDPLSVAEPLVIDSPSGDVRIGGRIDRVDLLSSDKGPEGIAVIDYKSGGRPARVAGRVADGQLLQLQLYLLAAGQSLGEALGAAPSQGMYYYLRDLEPYAPVDRFGNARKASQFGAVLDAARVKVGQIVEGVRAGRFPPAPSGPCPPWCEFRGLCRTAAWRIERKTSEEDDSASDT